MAAGASVLGMFTVAAHHRGRVPVALVLLYVASGLVAIGLFPDEDLGALASVAIGALLTLAAVGWGLARRSRRELMASLAERAERAEADQHTRVAEARRAERTRISNAEIGARLYLSVPTVRAHVSAVLDKLDAANRVQVALLVHDADTDPA